VAKLTTPRVAVILDDGTDDPKEHELQCLNIDMLTWDRERARRGWPLPDVAPMVWATYIAYRAALRTGLVEAGMSLDAWEAKALQVRVVQGEAEPSEVDPTRPEVEPA
jgi:hypothetical protein